MILILSQSEGDPSTEAIIDWLLYKGEKCFRINGNDLHTKFSFNISNIGSIINYQDQLPDIDEFKAVWFRRWGNPLSSKKTEIGRRNLDRTLHIDLEGAVRSHLIEESKVISEWFLSRFKGKTALSSSGFKSINKLEVLQKSRKIGLDIPDTLITNFKGELSDFIEKHTFVVTKSISNVLTLIGRLKHPDENYSMYTEQLDKKSLKAFPDTFATSLFQEKLNKDYEIRSFFLDGDFFSMAIFSQNNQKTCVDFRRYDTEYPNRNEPYILPAEIEDKLSNLMASLKLETGSIDLVKTIEGRFVFLEVNPVGQFGMVSYPCNYYLEEKVADALVKRMTLK